MTTPAHLNTTVCPYAFHQSAPIVDVETGGVGIITNLRTYLVTDRGWTEPSTALFQSPVDPGGRWYDILVSRISASEIEFRVRDHLAHTIITRRIDIDVAGTAINYFTGKFFCHVESLRATPELFQSSLLECSPDDDTAVPFALVANAYRNSSGTNDSQGGGFGQYFMWQETNQASVLGNDRTVCASMSLNGGVVGRNSTNVGSGSVMGEDVPVFSNLSSQLLRVGRMWHAYVVPSGFTFGSDKSFPVDDGNTTATFRVVGLTTLNVERMSYRKSDP